MWVRNKHAAKPWLALALLVLLLYAIVLLMHDWVIGILRICFVKLLGWPMLITWAVWIMFIYVGIWMGGRCWCRLCDENKLLTEKLDENYLKRKDGSGPQRCHEVLGKSEKKSSLLYQRLHVLLEDAGRMSGAERKLPSIEELHEITLRSELSRPDSSAMNAVVSVLLLLGILGTLTGVHEVLNADEYGLQLHALAPALQPSAWAVGGTVILTVFRASYLKRVDNYLGRLDAVTARYILPVLGCVPGEEKRDGKRRELTEALEGMGDLTQPSFGDSVAEEALWVSVRSGGSSAAAELKNAVKKGRPVVPKRTAAKIPDLRSVSEFVV